LEIKCRAVSFYDYEWNFRRRCPTRTIRRVANCQNDKLQEPITLKDSEPEPGLAIILGQRLDFRDRHPDAASLELVVEIADTSLERDRIMKQRIYARAGIPIYWILNLGDRQLEVYTQPNQAESIYQECQIFTETESVGLTLRAKEGAIGSICVGNLL
jgi:Uma2 family endonuclease